MQVSETVPVSVEFCVSCKARAPLQFLFAYPSAMILREPVIFVSEGKTNMKSTLEYIFDSKWPENMFGRIFAW